FLALTTAVTVASTAALAFLAPGSPNVALVALTLFVIGNVGFELGNVFYNAFLPDITSPERIGRVSGYGWGVGYVGGLVCLTVALVGFVQPEQPWFGVSTEAGMHIRATNLLVALWFGVFALPFLIVSRSVQPPAAAPPRPALREAFGELWRTFRAVRRYRAAARMLIARLFYNDGLNTIFAFGGIYAAGTFGMSFSDVLVFGIAINAAAGLGALAFGHLDDRIGGKRTILLSIAALTAATALAVWAPSRGWLWAAGFVIGVFAGPNQAASRSLMGRFTPDGRENEFFGFFAFTGKLAAFLGPALLGVVTEAAHSQRAGVATVIGFFVVGGLLLLRVDEKEGIAAASARA
ncbi:MAG TPA: MFS transporter, partial [Gemmatimonadales bacterium]|nr:MFS transporter [Gemmatimonadales bacterium]